MRQYGGGIYTDDQRCRAQKALVALQNGHFFEAHEVFEEIFRSSSGALREQFHGLAQVAASHHQLRLGRARAAVRTWHKARARLTRAGALTAAFACAMDDFHAQLGLGLEAPRFIDPTRLAQVQSFPLPVAETLHTPSA